MPRGNTRTQMPGKAIEPATAEACIAIAQRVARAHYLADDRIGGRRLLRCRDSSKRNYSVAPVT